MPELPWDGKRAADGIAGAATDGITGATASEIAGAAWILVLVHGWEVEGW